MQPYIQSTPASVRLARVPLAVVFVFAVTLFTSDVRGAEAGSGVVSGTVSNTATGNLLQGAKV